MPRKKVWGTVCAALLMVALFPSAAGAATPPPGEWDHLSAFDAKTEDGAVDLAGRGAITGTAGALSPVWLDDAGTDGALRFFMNHSASSTSNRNARYTLDQPVAYQSNASVSFDWKPGFVYGYSANELQLSLNASDGKRLFTMYVLGRDPAIYYYGEDVPGTTSRISSLMGRQLTPKGIELDQWFHVEASIYGGDHIAVRLTGEDGTAYTSNVGFPAGAYAKDIASIGFAGVNADSSATKQLLIDSYLDNVAVRSDALVAKAPTDIEITSTASTIYPTWKTATLTAGFGFDVSDTRIAWASSDPELATVTALTASHAHQATVRGAGSGTGKVTITATSEADGQVVGSYELTVAENPYDQYTDFDGGGNGGGTGADAGNIFTSAPNPTPVQGESRGLYMYGEGSGARSMVWSLKEPVEGGVVDLSFDYLVSGAPHSMRNARAYPSDPVDNPNGYGEALYTVNNTVMLSVQDAEGNRILTFVADDADDETRRIRYITGPYTMAQGVQVLGQPVGNAEVWDLNEWYAIDVTLDYLHDEIAFTLTERDDPSHTVTVDSIPMSDQTPPKPNVASLFLNGKRESNNNAGFESAVDNVGIEVVDPELPTYAVTGLSLTGVDTVAPGEQILVYPHVEPKNARNKDIVWSVDDPKIATIEAYESNPENPEGTAKLTGIGDGVVTVTAKTEDGGFVATKQIRVEPDDNPVRQLEKLDRGVVAVKKGDGVFVSWRLLDTDPLDATFSLYRNGERIATDLGAAYTDYTDASGTPSDSYSVTSTAYGVESAESSPVKVLTDGDDAGAYGFFDIPVERPVGYTLDGSDTHYTAENIYKGTTADLDGDGELEYVFLWSPANGQDNAFDGMTANVFIDAYKADGTKVWGSGRWIDLGPNIRAGAHYTQLLVYDFDGDGKAEIVVKTADGTKDAAGNVVGDPDKRWVTTGARHYGRVLDGPEYLTVFNGEKGTIMDTIAYNPPRGEDITQIWGDAEGNRADRFLAGVAHLSGTNATAIMTRGYYTRTTLWAVDWDGSDLKERWLFDTDEMEDGTDYMNQGHHQLAIADVDSDGFDEVVFGKMTVDDDGTGLYSTGLTHGDALHVGKFIPDRPGLQVVAASEGPNPYGLSMHDALTGEVIWGALYDGDAERAMTSSVDPNALGEQSWSKMGTYAPDGTRIADPGAHQLMAAWFDGDTGREQVDGTSLYKQMLEDGTWSTPVTVRFPGVRAAASKGQPVLTADLFGDWREELVFGTTDNSALRVFTTTAPTEHEGTGAVPETGIPSLLQDPTYRAAVAWQNGGYQQPTHTGFYLGYRMNELGDVPRSNVRNVTFDPNGGAFANGSDVQERRLLTQAALADPSLVGVVREGYAFDGWWDGATPVKTAADIARDTTLTAKWVEAGAEDAPEITLSADTVVQGGEVGVTGSEFAAGETVTITLHSDPVRLATVVADEAGAFSARVTIPADAAIGAHTLTADGGTSELSAQAAVTVTAAETGALAGTGAAVPVVLLLVVLGLVAAGGAMALVRRRRAQG